jgi:hypothetical protein
MLNENSSSKTSKIWFDARPMFRFKHGFTIISHLAFKTSGRYGVTPVFNEIIAKTKTINYLISVYLPARFGNNELSSLDDSLQSDF